MGIALQSAAWGPAGDQVVPAPVRGQKRDPTGGEDALPIIHCDKRRHYARDKLHLSWIAHECGDAPLGSGRTWGEVAGEAPTNEHQPFRVNPFLLQQPVDYR